MSELLSSSADTLAASVTVDSTSYSVGPVGEASGTAPPAFDKRVVVHNVNKSFKLDPSDPLGLTATVDAKGMVDTASSNGIGVDSVSTDATAVINSANLLLVDNPSPTLAIVALSLQAHFIHSESNSSYVFGPNVGSVSGEVKMGSLTIGGALLGGKTVTFKGGDVKPDTVIYSQDGVTITLDKQTLNELLPPTPAAGAQTQPIPNHIVTDAIDISFSNAHLLGHTINGDIAVGQTSADYYTSPVPPVTAS